MNANILAPQTAMGAVSLKVADLDSMIAFYRDGVGLTLLAHDGPSAVLGRPGSPAIILEHAAELKHAPSTSAGLYHTAFLFDEKSDLASSVYSVARAYPRNFTGSSDHLVSEAFYFNDPEGNGVELYWDRPRDSWKWQNGSVEMGTVYLDPNRFLQENLTEAGLSAATVGDTAVGHVHLKVGDIQTAKQFYVDTVGFEITIEYGTQALFVSAGGYHHHVGMNTWESNGAGARTPALGLGQVAIEVPSTDDLGALGERLTARGVQQAHDGRMLTFADPWANEIRVTAAA
ncbi:VOC family protein [Salinibacterium hongtaonis]|uniref:VOC family protein n=1 Tax=Homoserinimonas hongtaonis TaxID=2079791 RepID=UPI001E49791D|nr:VOC family protein [Salinibacterium hongtaonis]